MGRVGLPQVSFILRSPRHVPSGVSISTQPLTSLRSRRVNAAVAAGSSSICTLAAVARHAGSARRSAVNQSGPGGIRWATMAAAQAVE